jgi:hypothetical protein
MKGLNLTTEEKQLIIEALLFSSSAEVCSEWTPKHNQDMVMLAKKLNNPEINLTNIYLFDPSSADDKATGLVQENFPALHKASVYTFL